MRKSLGTGLTLALVLALSTAAAYAISLQPMFELTAANGECMVKRPTSADFEEGEQGKAFPYGSLVKTGKDCIFHIIQILIFIGYQAVPFGARAIMPGLGASQKLL